jgi:formamidase
MPQNLFPLDNTKKFTDQKHVGHNRWHPDIPPSSASARRRLPRRLPRVVRRRDQERRLRGRRAHAPLPGVHVLSGPFRVEGAEPGDLLIVDILEIDACDQEDEGPFSGMGWGYTGVFAKTQRRRLPDRPLPRRLQGDLGLHRRRRDVAAHPECSYVGIHHPGLMGTAPSAELLAKWTKRETDLIATDPDRVPPLALPPLPGQRDPGLLDGATSTASPSEGARTAPPRENGGNQDIKNFTAGTRVFYPVFVEGRTCPSATCTSRRATARSRSAARSRWAGSWTCTST